MTIYFVVNARVPNEKAHGIQIAHMQRALGAHARVVLISPNRQPFGLYRYGRGGYVLSSIFFMVRSLVQLLFKKLRRERFVIYTVDMDTFAYGLLPLAGLVFAEMHSPKPSTLVNRFFFRNVAGIIATTVFTKEKLIQTFGLGTDTVIVEPNGVDARVFKPLPAEEARRTLSLGASRTALYVGRMYGWKGLGILPEVARLLPHVEFFCVGIAPEEFGVQLPANFHALGVRPYEEIPLWLSAANVLLVVGTNRNPDSARYTSPMKVFEYLASGRPIVASRTEALQSMIEENEASWYEPDNVQDMARATAEALTKGIEEHPRVFQYEWAQRAQRIFMFITNHVGS